MRRRLVRVLSLSIAVASLAVLVVTGPRASGSSRLDSPRSINPGPRLSGVVEQANVSFSTSSLVPLPTTCSTPGSTNYRTDCHSSGRAVNETWITKDASGTLYAGANDYNSYNGDSQAGFYWSSDGITWNDTGPIDVFPHDPSNAAGDPGLAVGGDGAVYYSTIFFNRIDDSVGGVELMRRNTRTRTWSYIQIAANSSGNFQDKPAISADSSQVVVSWTHFGASPPIEVAVFSDDDQPLYGPIKILSVPGSTSPQGSTIAADGKGGFWVAWEEFASGPSIMLAHWDGKRWNTPKTISPAGFTDLQARLPGFQYRDNSFPALTLVNGKPRVVWTWYHSGTGRAYLWSATSAGHAVVGSLSTVANSGGDQFFPAVAPDGSAGVDVSFSQVNAAGTGYKQPGRRAPGRATDGSEPGLDRHLLPNSDNFFFGFFIGDYNGLVVSKKDPPPDLDRHPRPRIPDGRDGLHGALITWKRPRRSARRPAPCYPARLDFLD